MSAWPTPPPPSSLLFLSSPPSLSLFLLILLANFVIPCVVKYLVTIFLLCSCLMPVPLPLHNWISSKTDILLNDKFQTYKRHLAHSMLPENTCWIKWIDGLAVYPKIFLLTYLENTKIKKKICFLKTSQLTINLRNCIKRLQTFYSGNKHTWMKEQGWFAKAMLPWEKWHLLQEFQWHFQNVNYCLICELRVTLWSCALCFLRHSIGNELGSNALSGVSES